MSVTYLEEHYLSHTGGRATPSMDVQHGQMCHDCCELPLRSFVTCPWSLFTITSFARCYPYRPGACCTLAAQQQCGAIHNAVAPNCASVSLVNGTPMTSQQQSTLAMKNPKARSFKRRFSSLAGGLGNLELSPTSLLRTGKATITKSTDTSALLRHDPHVQSIPRARASSPNVYIRRPHWQSDLAEAVQDLNYSFNREATMEERGLWRSFLAGLTKHTLHALDCLVSVFHISQSQRS